MASENRGAGVGRLLGSRRSTAWVSKIGFEALKRKSIVKISDSRKTSHSNINQSAMVSGLLNSS